MLGVAVYLGASRLMEGLVRPGLVRTLLDGLLLGLSLAFFGGITWLFRRPQRGLERL